MIGDKEEIFINNGNHRIYMFSRLRKNIKIKNIPFKFLYINNHIVNRPSKVPVYTSDSADYYLNKLLPKWKRK